MSLDIYIKLKEKRLINPQKYACGSTVAMKAYEDDTINLNITHNMAEMAQHVPTLYINKHGEISHTTLYTAVWRPEELGIKTTTQMVKPLEDGITYMIRNRRDLLRYEPENGWGSYRDFLMWLVEYHEDCVENPYCEIEADR